MYNNTSGFHVESENKISTLRIIIGSNSLIYMYVWQF